MESSDLESAQVQTNPACPEFLGTPFVGEPRRQMWRGSTIWDPPREATARIWIKTRDAHPKATVTEPGKMSLDTESQLSDRNNAGASLRAAARAEQPLLTAEDAEGRSAAGKHHCSAGRTI